MPLKKAVAQIALMLCWVFCGLVFDAGAQPATDGTSGVIQRPAVVLAGATKAMMHSAANAGQRIVSVGDHGVVLLSDDDGKLFRQAKSVPTRATLNSVYFVDAKEGWAVGHWGVVLHTTDAGESWALQHDDLASDRPLFSVWFKDSKFGLASGLWGLILKTTDGGLTWQQEEFSVQNAKKGVSDKNLFAIFSVANGDLYIAAEKGVVFKSMDLAQTWKEIETGNTGTFWAGMALKDGGMLAAGLRGRIFRSDNGEHWTEVKTGNKSSITALAQMADGHIVAVGLDGVTLKSLDGGRSFSVQARPDRLPLTFVMPNAKGIPVIFSAQGPLLNK